MGPSADEISPGPGEAATRAGKLRWWVAGVLAGVIIVVVLIADAKSRRIGMDKSIISQARMLSAAADQYFLENGVSTVAYEALVGPTNYIKAISLHDREVYPAYYTQMSTITVTGIAGARTVTYAP